MGVVSYRGVDYSNKGPRIQNISEADYAALEQAGTIDPNTVYFRYELEDFGFNVQDDGTATTLLGGKVPTGRTIESVLDSKLIAFAKFKRVELDLTLAANGDVNITKADIATAAGVTNSKIYVVIPEGVRPKTTWNCKPSGIFYHSTYDRWGVHNNSTTADNIIVNFIIFYVL